MRTIKKIKINGTIIPSNNQWFYDWVEMEATSPASVQKALDEANGDDVELYINSPGGSVFAGSEIYTILKDYSGKVTAKITGIAASAASFISMAAENVLISPTAQIMIHKAMTDTYSGNSDVHQKKSKLLNTTDIAITNAYKLKTGLSQEELLDLMAQETFMDAMTAKEKGFADGIMFDEGNILSPSNSLGNSLEIPQALIDKFRNELFKNGKLDNLFAELENTGKLDGVQNIAGNGQQKEGDDKVMNLEELKANHPDLYAQVLNAGVTQERERITSLNALADAPGAAEIVAKAIADGKTAAEAAIEIVTASKQRVTVEAQARANDSATSNAALVPAEGPTPQPTAEQVAQAEADAIAAEMRKLRGGKE